MYKIKISLTQNFYKDELLCSKSGEKGDKPLDLQTFYTIAKIVWICSRHCGCLSVDTIVSI